MGDRHPEKMKHTQMIEFTRSEETPIKIEKLLVTGEAIF